MNCREFADFLNLYLDGELSPLERELFETHLAICPDCVAYLEGYRKTVTLVQRASGGDDDIEVVPEGLIQAILASRTKSIGEGKESPSD